MSSYTGLDISPSAIRWVVCEGASGKTESFDPIYGIRGCRAHSDKDYDSITSWSDPLEFREGTFDEEFDSGVEKTVSYEEPQGQSDKWLRSFFQSVGRRPAVDVNGTIAVAVADHASPEERDDVLSGLSATKYANVSLIWRPVAILLAWMDYQKSKLGVDLKILMKRRIFVLDLDGGRPELTELACVRHRRKRDWIVPSRHQPLSETVSADDEFEKACYAATLDGVAEWEQLVGGQFYGELQKSIENGDCEFPAWVRRRGAWSPRLIEFAAKLPKDILKSLDPIIAKMLKALSADDILLVNGWVARRYGDQITAPFKAKCGNVFVTESDSVAKGASLFAERLAKGLPTFYDRIADYRFWDGFKIQWVPMFDGEVEVEPGHEYRYPEEGQSARVLRVEKFSDNVSFYVRETNSKEYARKIKADFVEFLRTDLDLRLSAVVSPEKGSARFVLEMCDVRMPAIFVSGKTTVREIVLRWRNADNASASVSVRFIQEHQGYVEPQPVLGRIYDSEDNLRLVETYVSDDRSEEHRNLWLAYSKKYRPRYGNGIADRVGYGAVPREPTRGLFGTKYIPNARIDAAAHAFALRCSEEKQYTTAEGMKLQNYCHRSALQSYKDMLRADYAKGKILNYNFNYYYAPGYVLGDQPEDIGILMKYLYSNPILDSARCKLWWSFFRMLCWHPECRLQSSDLNLLEDCLAMIDDQDADIATSSGKFADNEKKFLLLAILYSLRIRESGVDLSNDLKNRLVKLLTVGTLKDVSFPQTMVPKINAGARSQGDTLSAYVVRFIRFEDTLADRELGAAMGGV